MHWKKKENLCRLLHGLDVITLSQNRDATKINALLTRPDYNATLQKLPDHVKCILNRVTSQPKDLMSLCRKCIVNALAPNSHTKVPRLQLPLAIQRYLLFRDLDELLLQMAGRKRKNNNNRPEHTVPASAVCAELSDSSGCEEDEESIYEVPVPSKKRTKKKRKNKECPVPKTAVKQRLKLCLCTI